MFMNILKILLILLWMILVGAVGKSLLEKILDDALERKKNGGQK